MALIFSLNLTKYLESRIFQKETNGIYSLCNIFKLFYNSPAPAEKLFLS